MIGRRSGLGLQKIWQALQSLAQPSLFSSLGVGFCYILLLLLFSFLYNIFFLEKIVKLFMNL